MRTSRNTRIDDGYQGKVEFWATQLESAVKGEGRYDLAKCQSSLVYFTEKAMQWNKDNELKLFTSFYYGWMMKDFKSVNVRELAEEIGMPFTQALYVSDNYERLHQDNAHLFSY